MPAMNTLSVFTNDFSKLKSLLKYRCENVFAQTIVAKRCRQSNEIKIFNEL